MPKISVVIFDNALNSQNQDYLPSRYLLQREVIEPLITKEIDANYENLIGLIPLAQKEENDIITPTHSRTHLSTFSYQADLYENPNHALAVFQADRSLYASDVSEKALYLFFCSPISESDDIFISLLSLASKGIVIKAVCFADAIEFGECLAQESTFDNLNVLIVYPDEDFNQKVTSFLDDGNTVVDPELQEAIRRSLIEK